jgi:hypothetical protein
VTSPSPTPASSICPVEVMQLRAVYLELMAYNPTVSAERRNMLVNYCVNTKAWAELRANRAL